ncbi:MAG TPA: aspartate aminotransferase family protein [Armatimonadota bacterium]|nr:aspartate aminotransferase family protein [Armatimonadota bacterium]
MTYDRQWADIDVNTVPNMVTPAPGPKSQALHARASKHMKGYSSQVRLFPVAFDRGHGVTLTDVDGNTYLDFSSGIYVTSLGHCHPKVTEAVQRATGELMNCHDFTTPIKTRLLELLGEIAPGDLGGVQLFDSGTAAVEAGLRICRAASDNMEFISFHKDFHGKSMGAVSLARLDPSQGLRAPGFHLTPRAFCYRCAFNMTHPECELHCLDYIDTVIKEETAGRLAAIVIEPIQGWAGSTVPPDDYFPALRAFCDERDILLFADEVLTCMARTGKMFCVEHWGVAPDVMTLGKGLGNGFPVTAMLVSDRFKERVERISASTSYGGNPMACAAAVASIEVILEEGLVERSAELGDLLMKRMVAMKGRHPLIGDVRGKGCLLGIELVKDRATKEPAEEEGQLVYQKAFSKGLAWIPAGNVLRMSPPLIMDDAVALKGMDIIEESIAEVEAEKGYA